jgi:hypothetical protein
MPQCYFSAAKGMGSLTTGPRLGGSQNSPVEIREIVVLPAPSILFKFEITSILHHCRVP